MDRKPRSKVVEILNEAFNSEVGAIGVYMDQHFHMDDAGYDKLAELLKSNAKDEMGHAEKLAERILMIGGAMAYGKHVIPDPKRRSIQEIIKVNVELETEAVAMYNRGIHICAAEGDNASRRLLEEILMDEERHLDDMITRLGLLKDHGDHYIAEKLM